MSLQYHIESYTVHKCVVIHASHDPIDPKREDAISNQCLYSPKTQRSMPLDLPPSTHSSTPNTNGTATPASHRTTANVPVIHTRAH